MYSSVQPGMQIGVHVSPFVIELRAIMKLNITNTSKDRARMISVLKDYFMLLTFRLYLTIVISEYIDDVELRDYHPESKFRWECGRFYSLIKNFSSCDRDSQWLESL